MPHNSGVDLFSDLTLIAEVLCQNAQLIHYLDESTAQRMTEIYHEIDWRWEQDETHFMLRLQIILLLLHDYADQLRVISGLCQQKGNA